MILGNQTRDDTSLQAQLKTLVSYETLGILANGPVQQLICAFDCSLLQNTGSLATWLNWIYIVCTE